MAARSTMKKPLSKLSGFIEITGRQQPDNANCC